MTKTFQTLTIRNLDDEGKAEIVEIMNEIAKENSLATGQQIFEKGMQEWRWYKMKYEAERDTRQSENFQNRNKIRELEAELTKYKTVINHLKLFQQSFSEI